MSDSTQEERVEIYKLHAALADRVSERREGANRLYVSLIAGILIFLAALVRFGNEQSAMEPILIGAGLLGALLCAAWYIVIRSYRQLNSGKFKALHELEQELVYPFFKREWEFLAEGKDTKRYWKLTVVETFLPVMLGVGFIAITGITIWSLIP